MITKISAGTGKNKNTAAPANKLTSIDEMKTCRRLTADNPACANTSYIRKNRGETKWSGRSGRVQKEFQVRKAPVPNKSPAVSAIMTNPAIASLGWHQCGRIFRDGAGTRLLESIGAHHERRLAPSR